MDESRYAKSGDGSVIGFRVFGEGPPMVLVHGAAVDGRCWTPVVPGLAERFTVHVMDRRGRGLSMREGGPHGLGREGEDVAAVVEAAGRDVFLVGHSYGALCALNAVPHTGAIGRIVLYEPPVASPWREVAPPEVMERLRAAADGQHYERLLEIFLGGVIRLSPRQVEALRGARRFWRTSLENAPPLLRETESVGRIEDCARFAGAGVPVRMLVGERSPGHQRPTAEAIAALIPGADVAVLPGQGHMAMLEDPGLLTEALCGFAAQVGPGAGAPAPDHPAVSPWSRPR
ncbi:alpha/beta fold hydrolase [Actinomadura sp. 7K507]|uniref:alpha/beta fold hydrolase n=1 Tax=Actinomadura sp. 7K507 TaxID=2530365 RepID=UPI001046EF6E|nr:alpha/beta fold hydrolase [Actinomadura sp. 7K507]TDC95309.1 alpha/beta hydrolase [Actinomadura sp. 7K507]